MLKIAETEPKQMVTVLLRYCDDENEKVRESIKCLMGEISRQPPLQRGDHRQRLEPEPGRAPWCEMRRSMTYGGPRPRPTLRSTRRRSCAWASPARGRCRSMISSGLRRSPRRRSGRGDAQGHSRHIPMPGVRKAPLSQCGEPEDLPVGYAADDPGAQQDGRVHELDGGVPPDRASTPAATGSLTTPTD